MSYKGTYKLKNPEKYVGDPSKVVYRSLWERQTFRWLESNSSVVEWCSEEIVIPYLCETDNKKHRYFVDIYFKTASGETYLIEIKPKKETEPPKKTPNRKKYISESLTYIKNQSKWKAAKAFCEYKGWHFEIWTEDTLQSLGIKLINNTRTKKTSVRKKK